MKQCHAALTLLFIVIFSSIMAPCLAQQSNITISTSATSGGSFTGAAPSRAFTITADNAVINAAALATELLTSSVSISTARPGGTQAGDISVTAAVTAAATTSVAKTLTLTAGGTINVSGAITLTPAQPSGNTAGRLATNITMSAVTAISISAALTTTGGKANNSGTFNTGAGADGSNAGTVSITAGTTFTSTSAGTITSRGGDGSSGSLSFTSRDGGNGGAVSITAPVSVSLAGAINTTGGSSSLAGNGGNGAAVSILATSGALTLSGAVTTSGGSGVSADGANISIRGSGGITLTANLTSAAGGVGGQGNLTVNDGGTVVTSGGTNDGQSAASIINVADLTKTGAGNFNISGTNTYTGNTTITAGTVRVSSSAASGASTNGAFGNNNVLGTATLTLTNAALEFNNATFTRAIVISGSSRLDAYGAARVVTPAISGTGTLTIGATTVAGGAGQDLSLGGVISGALVFVKSFSSLLTVTAANTFTGNKTLNLGTLNINNANALGTIAGTFIIAGGTIDNTTAASITTLAYIQTWSGDFNFTGTAALNLGAGAITMSASRQVTVNASTLTAGGIILAPTLSLTKLGAGILHLGATAKTFSSVTISAGQLTSTSATLGVGGNFVNNAIYAANGGTAQFNGSTQSISGTTATTAFSTLTILNGSTTTGSSAITATLFNLNSGAKYIQQAGTTIPGTTKNFVSGSIYELQAVGVTFSGATYGTLIINFASGNTSTSGVLTSVLNDLIIQNTGTGSFRLAANTSPVITVAGNIQINAGKLNVVTGTGSPLLTVNGNLVISGGTFQPMTSTGVASVFVKGNWQNNGIFTAGTGIVTFNGSLAPQNISGASANTFYNLTDNNTDPSGLSLDADITVSNSLNLSSASNGIFSTGDNVISVSATSVAAVTRTGVGYVVGNLRRNIAPAGGAYDYPVGSFLGYTPANLTFNSGNTAGYVNVTTADGVSANYPSTLSNTNQLARTWIITNGNTGAYIANALFTFLPDDLLNGATAANLRGYKFIAPTTYDYSANTSNSNTSFTFNGINSLGEFGAGECSGGLAIDGIVTNVTCNSGTDGSIITSLSGNTTPVAYSWNTNPVQTTANLINLAAGVYSVTVSEQTTCSASNTFTVTQPAALPAPVSGGDQTVCSNGSPSQTLAATASSSNTIIWYSTPTGGVIIANPVQIGVGSVTYYAESFDGTCSSLTRTAVSLTINPIPASPTTGGDQVVCSDGTANQTLTATATSAAAITWYDASSGGNVVANPQQVGVGTNVYYAEANNGLCHSLTRTSVTLTINPIPAIPVSGGDQTVCSDGTPSQTITATATSAAAINWYTAATGGTLVANPVQVGVGTATYYAEANNGLCPSLARTAVTLAINPVPASPVTGGDQVVCSDGTANQTLAATATSAATISWYDASSGGNVVANPQQVGVGTSVYYAEANNGLCSSLARTSVTLTINPIPADPAVSVSQPTCASSTGSLTINSPTGTGLTYSIGAAYQSSPLFSSVMPGIYTINVANSFGCTALTAASAIVNQQPVVPSGLVISGIVNVCPYINTGTQLTYTATANGATGFTWVLPPHVTLVSGMGTQSIVVTIDSGFTFQPNKQIRVTANSICGTSALVIFYLAAQFPSTPGPITGPTDICALIGTQNTATYTIRKVLAATSYAWSTQPNSTSVSHPGGTGVNDTIIVVTYAANYTSSSITVAAVNACNTSGSVRSLSVPRVSAPTPGLISGPSNVCANILPNGNAATYSIVPIPGVTSYTWTTPANAVVTHPNGTGAGDVSITVQFPAGFTSGILSVSATNGCGTGLARTLNLNKLTPATPSVIDVIQTESCPNRLYSYTLSAMPANATSVQWTIPAGATIVSQSAISITVFYPASSIQGNVTVQGVNNCAASTTRISVVKLPACAATPPPPPPFAKNAKILPAVVQSSGAGEGILEVETYPNPTISYFNLKVVRDGNEKVDLKILDMQGRAYKTLTVMPNETIMLGADLKPGSYILEIIQGKSKITRKLVKF